MIIISGMLLLAYWFEVARYFLFTHHLFWMIGIFLLINPVSETFWPDPSTQKKKRRITSSGPSAKAWARQEARKWMDGQKHASSSESILEQLVRLHKQKEAVDQQIEKLTKKQVSELNHISNKT